MRKSLFTAAAVAPLMMCASGAFAATTINTATTTPVITSTVNNGQPDDVVIGAGGAIDLATGVAITVNSNNTVTNGGALSTDGGDGSGGILVLTPYTGSITNTATINIADGYTAEDTNDDGIPDGAFATGTGRFGIRVMGPGVFTGPLISSGTITVEGNDSFGVSIESAMVGDVTLSGTTTVTGDRTYGFRETGGVDGKIMISGTLSATGKDAVAVDIGGDVTGSLRIYASMQATGYRIVDRITDPEVVEGLLPENVQQSGSALVVRGDVLGGIFLGAPPAKPEGATDDATRDLDKDGVLDAQEGTADVRVFGSAPAVLIGEAGDDIQIGKFGVDENAYGLIIRGAVRAAGVYDNISATGIQLGVAGGTVTVDGGVRVVGSVTTTAFKADATGLRILSGTQANALIVEGGLTSALFSETASTAAGVDIAAGASLTSLNVSGSLSGAATGDLASAYAVRDASGTLSDIVNSGNILAKLVPSTGGTATGQAIALDLRQNTSGITLVQNPNSKSTDAAPINPRIDGDILFGSGDDTVALHAGTVTGALDFAGGAGSFTIDGGASYQGALSSSGVLTINVADGTLDNRGTTVINASSLNVGSDGALIFALSPNTNSASQIVVSGTATLADGAQLGVSVLALPTETETFNVLTAGTLDVQGDLDGVLGAVPYLVVAAADIDEGAGTIDVTLRRRTAAEANFNAAQTAGYDAVYNNLSTDTAIRDAFLRESTRDGLVGLYDQMLPDHAGGILRSLSWAQEAVGAAAGDWPRGQGSSSTRAWTAEIGLGEQKEERDAAAWNLYGFNIAGGVESVAPDGDALGVQVNFTAANVTNPDTPGDDVVGVSQLGGGVYYRGVFGGFRTDAQLGAGWMWAHGEREFLATTGGVVVRRQAEADWTGYSIYSRLGLAYEWTTGNLVVTPGTHLDYFRLHESGYEESGGGAGFDLTVDDRTSDVLSLTSSILIGYEFGDKVRWRPHIELGWRHILAGSGGATRGFFTGGGTPFDLPGENISGGAPIVRLGMRVYSGWLDLKVDAGGEFRDEYTDLDLRLTARIIF